MNMSFILVFVAAVYCSSYMASSLPDRSGSVAQCENLLYVDNQTKLMPTDLPFRATYSTGTWAGKSYCNKCKGWIPKDTMQMAYIQMSMTEDSLEPIWFHKSCFFEIRRPIGVGAIDGFQNLRYNDRKEIHQCLGTDQPLDSELEKQNADFFVVYDSLKTMETEDWVAILNAQNQFVPEDKAEILTHLTDVITFGALSPCPVCKSPLVFRNTGYFCTGYDSPWSKCLYGVKSPERVPLTIPAQYHNLFGEKTQPRTRIIQSDFRINDREFEFQAKQPLFGMEFVIIGETKQPKSEIEDKIRKMGGKVVPNVHREIAAVISTKHEVNNAGEVMEDVLISRIQVIPEECIDEVMRNDPIEVFNGKDMNKRGRFLYERISELKPTPMETYKNEANGPDTGSWQWKSGEIPKNIVWNNNIYYNTGFKVHQIGDLKYNVMLNFVDIGTNKNSYHKLQLLINTGGNFISESKGRIGTSFGTSSTNNFGTLEAARTEFHRIFLESTGNEFGSGEFVKKPGKYYKVDIDRNTLDRKVEQNSKPTKLSDSVYRLMQMFFDENMMQSTLQAFYFDIRSLPLGLVHKRTLQNAIEFLEKMSTTLNGTNTQNLREILAALNEFYSYFPHDSFLARVPLINTLQIIQEKIEMMRNVLDKTEKYNSFLSKSAEEKNLADVCYGLLEQYTEIRPLGKSSKMYAEIVKYVKNTQTYSNNAGPSYYGHSGFWEIEDAFVVSRHEEEIRFEPHESNFNRQLLFHGSKINNFASILMNGLQIKMYRKFHGSWLDAGIYFADSILTSVGYTDRSTTGSSFILLCEVAAGLSDIRHYRDNSNMKFGSGSVQFIGQWCPESLHQGPGGLFIPNGELIKQPQDAHLQLSEFIVFDEARVKIRYLIKVKQGSQFH